MIMENKFWEYYDSLPEEIQEYISDFVIDIYMKLGHQKNFAKIKTSLVVNGIVSSVDNQVKYNARYHPFGREFRQKMSSYFDDDEILRNLKECRCCQRHTGIEGTPRPKYRCKCACRHTHRFLVTCKNSV